MCQSCGEGEKVIIPNVAFIQREGFICCLVGLMFFCCCLVGLLVGWFGVSCFLFCFESFFYTFSALAELRGYEAFSDVYYAH